MHRKIEGDSGWVTLSHAIYFRCVFVLNCFIGLVLGECRSTSVTILYILATDYKFVCPLASCFSDDGGYDDDDDDRLTISNVNFGLHWLKLVKM